MAEASICATSAGEATHLIFLCGAGDRTVASQIIQLRMAAESTRYLDAIRQVSDIYHFTTATGEGTCKACDRHTARSARGS